MNSAPQETPTAVLVRDGLLTMELGIVHRLFGQALSPAGEPLYEVLTCTPEPATCARTPMSPSVSRTARTSSPKPTP
ncbi:hypothetical protein GCM10010346_25210 [Streptomyces chryseus]|uniref:Uncharacterized protein n=1 Tax=Streptomyces chryseus TaxID=68186 RepID=A0ABQ3DKP7_9ACTN|nr:hypothetical protein GCM10010346_25210 [Streptomyces chryseus]